MHPKASNGAKTNARKSIKKRNIPKDAFCFNTTHGPFYGFCRSRSAEDYTVYLPPSNFPVGEGDGSRSRF